jgi:hypothetical protein
METFEQNVKRGGYLNLHITKLFGENVEVFLHNNLKNKVNVTIIIKQNEKKMTADIGSSVESIRSLLKTVVIDCQEECNDYFYFIEMEDISYLNIFEMNGVEFDFEKCSVCLSATQSKTICNHDLCLACLPKCKKCPICRFIF